jgi:hypothetical protein
MKALIDEITKLTEEWYFLIGKDHHKDKDCHWYIETKWSYGYSPKYTVQHWGYILDDIEEEFSSYEEALIGLKNILTEKLKEETEWQKENDEW